MATNSLAISLTINASLDRVWNSILDWPSQSKWMLLTRVWVTKESSAIVGTHIAAFTGPAPSLIKRERFLGVLDLMEVTKIEKRDSSALCEVAHYGKLIKGSGSFLLTALDLHRTQFDWSETVEAPRFLFLLIKPFLALGVQISLRRFAKGF